MATVTTIEGLGFLPILPPAPLLMPGASAVGSWLWDKLMGADDAITEATGGQASGGVAPWQGPPLPAGYGTTAPKGGGFVPPPVGSGASPDDPSGVHLPFGLVVPRWTAYTAAALVAGGAAVVVARKLRKRRR